MQDIVLNSMVSGVYVLTAQHQGRINGSTIAWTTPVAYDPFLIMVSLADIRVSHGLVKSSGLFGLNVLTKEQLDLARDFGFTSGRDTNKFENVPYKTSENGLPILDGARAYIECRVIDSFPAADHTMFVGEVVSAEILKDNSEPLVFKQEDFF